MTATLFTRGTTYAWLNMLGSAYVAAEHGDQAAADQLIQQCPLAVAVIDLRRRRVVAMSPRIPRLIGMEGVKPEDIDLRLLVDDPPLLDSLLDLVANGSIDAYEARRGFHRPDGKVVDADHWVTTCQLRERGQALWLAFPLETGDEDVEDEVPTPPEAWPANVAGLIMGVMDAGWRVQQISVDSKNLLGTPASAMLGASLLERIHPDDKAAFLAAVARALAERAGIGIEVRMGQTDAWGRVQIVVSPVVDGDLRFGFAITGTGAGLGENDARTTRLEQHLWRIAREIEAAGMAVGAEGSPDVEAIPGLAELSPRQWEVLRRLLQGERVPGIAKGLFVSASTVRNHLTAIFAKLGVHSQEELIQLLKAGVPAA